MSAESQSEPEPEPTAALVALLDDLPEELRRQVFTHASFAGARDESYARLAFLGDAVLGLAVGEHLFRDLDDERAGIGRLTKVRNQAVSNAAGRVVADRLGVPDRLRAALPAQSDERTYEALTSERVLASVVEAIIGASFLTFGYERTAAAVVEAFAPETAEAIEHPIDFKSTLQDRLPAGASPPEYVIVDESGPPHDRRFTSEVRVDGELRGSGDGASKKAAEQSAAHAALGGVEPAPITGGEG